MASRGIRNNNPLNIRKGNDWQGEVRNQTDKSFEQFTSMQYGCRAAFILLRKYINVYHCDTIAKIITKWAPPHENNTSSYINFVSTKSGINKNAKISFTDKDALCKILSAMIIQENSQEVDMNVIRQGYDMI